MSACIYFSLVSGMQIANFLCRIISSLHPVLLYHILPTNSMIFEKKMIEHKMCVLIFSTLSETFLIRRRIQPHIMMHLHRSTCTAGQHVQQVNMYSACYSCHILMKLECYLQIFEKSSNIKVHKNPSREPSCRMRTDGHDESDSRFPQCCEPP